MPCARTIVLLCFVVFGAVVGESPPSWNSKFPENRGHRRVEQTNNDIIEIVEPLILFKHDPWPGPRGILRCTNNTGSVTHSTHWLTQSKLLLRKEGKTNNYPRSGRRCCIT